MLKLNKRIILIAFLLTFFSLITLNSYALATNENLYISLENNKNKNVIGVRQYSDISNIKNITIEEGITEIHDEAFANCANLTDITIPSSATYISKWAFWNCPNSITVHGYVGSEAETYANNYGYNFDAIGYMVSTKSLSNTIEGIYSLDEELINNNLSEYPDIYNVNNIYNATKVSLISSIQRLSKIKSNSTYSFGFITDTHINAEGNNNSETSINAFSALSKTGNIDLGIVGGDLYSGYETNYQEGLNYERHAVDKLSKSSVPLLYVKGNHECNIKTGISNRISDTKLSQVYNSSYDATQTTGIVYNENDLDGLYYYKDNEDKKIRMCVLNSFDGETEDTEFDESQLKFIAKNMLNFSDKSNPNEWSVLFFVHRYQDSVSKTMFVNIVNAFQNGTSIELDGENINYSNQGKGQVIAVIGGDVHVDSSNCNDGFWYITTTHAFASSSGDIATTEETAFDIYTIDTENKKLYATRVGRGEDREWDYSETQFKIKDLSYEYDVNNNTVKVTVVTNRKLAEIKPTWNISEDKYSYSKIYYYEQVYSTTFTDIYGNIVDCYITITDIVNNIFSVNIKYTLNSDNTVTATAYANLPFNDTKTTWELSSDRLSYSKTFNTNQCYETSFECENGMISTKQVEIEHIDTTSPNITISQNYNSNGTITIIASSDEKLADTKSTWIISENGMKYYKTIYSNYTTTNTEFIDIFGNSTVKTFAYNIQNTPVATYQYGKILNCENQVLVIVNSTLPMQQTKVSWTLSNDNMAYYKVYDDNYTTNTVFTDLLSNTFNLDLTIDEIKINIIPVISIQYVKNDDSTVTVYVISDEKLQDLNTTWTLSADRYIYSKTYSENCTTSSSFTDIFGNITQVYDIVITEL